jgi:hypothetical protein
MAIAPLLLPTAVAAVGGHVDAGATCGVGAGAGAVVGQARAIERYAPRESAEEAALTAPSWTGHSLRSLRLPVAHRCWTRGVAGEPQRVVQARVSRVQTPASAGPRPAQAGLGGPVGTGAGGMPRLSDRCRGAEHPLAAREVLWPKRCPRAHAQSERRTLRMSSRRSGDTSIPSSSRSNVR